MARACAVKLTNTTVDNAIINGTDTDKLLEANYSVINELNGGLFFVNESSDIILEPMISLLSSKVTINELDITEVTNNTEFLIYSNENSVSYFKSILYDVSYAPIASPSWTPYDAVHPNYSNMMSYNIYEFIAPPPTPI